MVMRGVCACNLETEKGNAGRLLTNKSSLIVSCSSLRFRLDHASEDDTWGSLLVSLHTRTWCKFECMCIHIHTHIHTCTHKHTQVHHTHIHTIHTYKNFTHAHTYVQIRIYLLACAGKEKLNSWLFSPFSLNPAPSLTFLISSATHIKETLGSILAVFHPLTCI